MVYLNSPQQYPKKIWEVVVKSTCFFIDIQNYVFFCISYAVGAVDWMF